MTNKVTGDTCVQRLSGRLLPVFLIFRDTNCGHQHYKVQLDTPVGQCQRWFNSTGTAD